MPQRVEHLLDQRQLAAELGRASCCASPCTRRTRSQPEGLPGHVEGHGDVGRLLVAQHVDQHRGEAVDRVGVLAGRGREVLHRQREERAVGQRVAVEQEEASRTPRLYPGRRRRAGWRHERRRPDRRRVLGDAQGMGGLNDRWASSSSRSPPSGSSDHAGRGQHPALRLLHGGASVVLAETLGSVGSAATPPRPALGRRRHQRHPPPLRHVGTVTGVATAVHLGRTSRPTRSSSPTSGRASAPRGSPAR